MSGPMGPGNPRMSGPPRHPGMGGPPPGMNAGYGPPPPHHHPPGMRPPPPNANMPLPPMGGHSMAGGPGRPWQPNPSNLNFSSPSPGSHYGPGGGVVPVSGPNGGPGTPGGGIMQSPSSQGPYSPANHRMGTPNTGPAGGRDSVGGPESMYGGPMMKGPGGGNMSGVRYSLS